MKTNLRIREVVTAGLMVSGVALLSPSVALSQSATPGNIRHLQNSNVLW
jgi:hypothetical protein